MIVTATGVYGNSENEFFQKLLDEQITLFIDVRQRRGMRGSQYSFANSTYLQNKLKNLGIQYIHIKELAPTTFIRNEQKNQDTLLKTTKSKRDYLGDRFIELYTKNILDAFDFQYFINKYDTEKIVFFCVEKECKACHRSLIVDKMKKELLIDGYCF